jgi:spore coat protein CotH
VKPERGPFGRELPVLTLGEPDGQSDPDPLTLPRPCADLYSQELLPTFELELTASDWKALAEDLREGEEPYYPATFRYGAESVPAMVRLRGNNSDCGEKLQLAISFNQVDKKARFHGLRRLNLDHGGCHTMEERLALSFARDLGLPAACANHARLVVNGTYYGLFTNIEHVNKDFLQRNFGSGDEGNLYKSGDKLRTNEEEADLSDLEAYEDARDLLSIEAQVDLEEAVLAWALEAVLPALDNYWLHGWNYYLYNHPTRGFLFIPTDFDQAWPRSSSEVDLDFAWPGALQHPADVVLEDPHWRARYEAALDKAARAWNPDVFDDRIDRWYAQVKQASAEDPFDTISERDISRLKTYQRERARWLRENY